jgi:hypothetical protein
VVVIDDLALFRRRILESLGMRERRDGHGGKDA